jgi:hypothetical protein
MDNMYPAIKVLWIDDLEDQPDGGESFMTLAETRHGILIDNCLTVDDGIRVLQNPTEHYDAIILDINCRRNKEVDGVVSYKSLSYAIQQLSKHNIDTPYFVYSALAEYGPTLVNIVVTEERTYDTTALYNKPADRELLFESIKRVVSNWDEFQLKKQYAEAFGIVPDGKLIELLKLLKTDGFETNTNIPKLIRPILEDLAHHFADHKLIVLNNKKIENLDGDEISKSNHSKDLSLALSRDKNNRHVPSYVQRTIHFLSECSNEGCHSYKSEDAQFKIPYLIANGYAKYLNMHMVLGLLNLLVWANSLPFDSTDFASQWRQHLNISIKPTTSTTEQ